METVNYEIIINAPIEDVWDLLWSEKTYPQWTQFFPEGSKMKSDWEVGGKTYFLNANDEGMVSTIRSLRKPYEVVFSHLGTVKDGIEDTESREVVEWSGAEEKYFLRNIDANTTELRAIVHASPDMQEMIDRGFNEGFALIKKIVEV